MKYLGGLLILVAVTYSLYVVFPTTRKYHAMQQDTLQRLYDKVDAEVKLRDATMTTPDGGLEALAEMRHTRFRTGLELKRRNYRTDAAVPLLGGFGILFLILSSWGRSLRIRREEAQAKPKITVDVPEAAPREEYVDEFDFHKRSEAGFKTREEAVRWLLQDPLLTCDYCGSKLRSTFQGDREVLELVTFYKRVPEGAKDMRIILGSLWFAKAASELKCAGCQRVIRR
jgi:hypothetical protein